MMKPVQARWIESSIHALPFATHDNHVVYVRPVVTRYLAADMMEFGAPGESAALLVNKYEKLMVQEIHVR